MQTTILAEDGLEADGLQAGKTIQETKRRRLNWAHSKGFIEAGWTLEDYIKNAPLKYRWECFPIWGIKGSYKSNRLMALLYLIYQDWKLVHKYMIMQPLEFTDLLKTRGRIPMVGWDDIGAWFDSQLYFENRGLYTKIKRSWTLMRTKLNVFCATIPRKDELPGFILRDINAEMFCSPAMTYDYDRWGWRMHYRDPTKVVKIPLNVQRNEKFDIMKVPRKEFQKYWDRRINLANEASDDLIEILEEAFGTLPEVDKDFMTTLYKKVHQVAGSRNADNKLERARQLVSIVDDFLEKSR